MLTQLTSYGVTVMQTASAPITLTSYKLGSASNYVPSPTQTDIQGALIATGAPALPVVETSNFVRYYVELANSAGPYQFGEIGLYLGNQLFAICVLDSPLVKIPLDPNTNTGGAIIIDFNVPSVGLNYQMWTNTAQSNTTKVSQVAGPEELPQVVGTAPNLYVVDSTNGTKPFLAYTDHNGLWSFDSYSEIGVVQCVDADQQTLTITGADAEALEIGGGPVSNLLVQIADGDAFASCRWINNAVLDGPSGNLILQFNSPIFKDIQSSARVAFSRLGAPSSTQVNVSALLTIKTVPGNYTLNSTDYSDQLALMLKVVSAAPTALFIPDNATVSFPVGANILVSWGGVGQVSIQPGSSAVTVLTPSTPYIAQRYGKIAIVQTALNVWELEGNLQQL